MVNSIVLLGPPGCGKGTQSQFIIEKTQFSYISAGDILRRHLREKTDIGIQIRSIVDSGSLVPDALITQVIRHELIQLNSSSVATDKLPLPNGFLFDGFPRTIGQADALYEILIEQNNKWLKVIQIEVSNHDKLIQRIIKRSQQQHRKDDTSEIVANRLKVYFDQTYPLLEYYKSRGQLIMVDGSKSIEAVRSDIMQFIE